MKLGSLINTVPAGTGHSMEESQLHAGLVFLNFKKAQELLQRN
jgi:hypothetical protein